jgi:hypothetical protein
VAIPLFLESLINFSYVMVPKCCTNSTISIDYRCADLKKVGELRGDILVPFDTSSLIPLTENPDIQPQKKKTVTPRDVFENAAFERWVEIAKSWNGSWRSCSSLTCETDTTNRFMTSS